MKNIYTIITILFAVCLANANESIDRLNELEARIKNLESQIAPILEQQNIITMSKNEKYQAMQRILRDGDVYSQNQQKLIEGLYQTIKNGHDDIKSKESLSRLRNEFPYANRTGCALLITAMHKEGKEKQLILSDIISKYSDCYFSDGVNVGAYARLYLALDLRNEGESDKANLLIQELEAHYPYAIDHQGRRLVEHLNDLKMIFPRP